MAWKIDFDEVINLYRLNPDGESVEGTAVLGKKAYDEKIAEGWTDTCPRGLPFPKQLYRPDGSVHRVENREDMNYALSPHRASCTANCALHGWELQVYAAPKPPLEMWEIGQNAPAAVATQENVNLALALMVEQEKRVALEQKLEQLIASMGNSAPKPARAKPGRKPKVHEEVTA